MCDDSCYFSPALMLMAATPAQQTTLCFFLPFFLIPSESTPRHLKTRAAN
jgi:hypothetical protein